MIPAGRRRHLVALTREGAPVADANGGYTRTLVALNPAEVYAEIRPATAHDLERLAAGTSIATAASIVTMPHHAEVDTKTRVTFNGRTLRVTGVVNPDERNIHTICVCVEVVS